MGLTGKTWFMVGEIFPIGIKAWIAPLVMGFDLEAMEFGWGDWLIKHKGQDCSPGHGF